nr:glycosyltransferase [Microbacterium testaceum]
MNVVFYCVSEKLSGGELFTVELAVALRELGHDAVIAATVPSAVATEASARGITVSRTRVGPKLGRRTAARILVTWPLLAIRLRRELRAQRSATVVVLQYKLEQLLYGLAGPSSVPVVILEHGPIPRPIQRVWPLSVLYRRACRRARALIAVSEPATVGLGPHADLVFAGISADRLAQLAPVETPSPPRDAERLRFVFAGRLTEGKGVVHCLALAQSGSHVEVTIAGAGPLEPEVRAAASRTPNITFAGVVDDVLPLVSAADFALLLTTDPGEGRPLFAIECLAAGVPVVALRSSHAMRALADEFGPSAVRLVDGATPAEILGQCGDRTPIQVELPTWADTARSFVTAVEKHRG